MQHSVTFVVKNLELIRQHFIWENFYNGYSPLITQVDFPSHIFRFILARLAASPLDFAFAARSCALTRACEQATLSIPDCSFNRSVRSRVNSQTHGAKLRPHNFKDKSTV